MLAFGSPTLTVTTTIQLPNATTTTTMPVTPSGKSTSASQSLPKGIVAGAALGTIGFVVILTAVTITLGFMLMKYRRKRNSCVIKQVPPLSVPDIRYRLVNLTTFDPSLVATGVMSVFCLCSLPAPESSLSPTTRYFSKFFVLLY